MSQTVQNLPAMQETWVRSLGQEDPLEKRMATHSCILDWRTPWTEEPGGLQSKGHKESNTTERLTFFLQKFKLCLYSWNIKYGNEESTSEGLLNS